MKNLLTAIIGGKKEKSDEIDEHADSRCFGVGGADCFFIPDHKELTSADRNAREAQKKLA